MKHFDLTKRLHWRANLSAILFAALCCFATSDGQLASAGPFNVTPVPDRKPLDMNRTYLVTPSDETPVPDEKPNFSRPVVSALLDFGTAPRPKPRPLRASGEEISPKNAALYREIFALQANGEWDKADAALNLLTDFELRGHVLFQRLMHPTKYRASFEELRGWMDMYADHPRADKVYKLALARMPADYKGHIPRPQNSIKHRPFLDILIERDNSYISYKHYTTADKRRIATLQRDINRLLSRGAPTRAYKILTEHDRITPLDPVEFDELQALIARSYMIAGKYRDARKLASKSALRSGNKVPIAGWVGGLVAWRQHDYKLASALFELTATSPYTSSWTKAAGAYWASRAHLRAGNVRDVSKWLKVAAEQPRTFYGLIATRALGYDFDFNWNVPAFTQEHAAQLSRNKAGSRAMALAAAGQYHLAEAELRQIDPKNNTKLEEALLSYAAQASLPSFSMRLAESTPHPNGGVFDAAFYPLSPWRPQSGYKVDRALINALIRQESRFDPYAENGRSGATGLMQLMPQTAKYVAKHASYNGITDRFTLRDPQVNLDIGQHYIETLMGQRAIDSELFSLAIAYNAGPGNLRRWKRQFADMNKDPLLFIESIPMSETRAFVERVMANYWIYRIRLSQPTPSLDSVAKGGWAQYVKLDNVREAAVPETKPYDNKTGRNSYAKISSR